MQPRPLGGRAPAWMQADYQAVTHCTASLRLYQRLRDRLGEAKAHRQEVSGG